MRKLLLLSLVLLISRPVWADDDGGAPPDAGAAALPEMKEESCRGNPLRDGVAQASTDVQSLQMRRNQVLYGYPKNPQLVAQLNEAIAAKEADSARLKAFCDKVLAADRQRAKEQAQKQAAAEQAAQAQAEALMASRQSDPKWMRPVLSALVCQYQTERKRAMGKIAEEHHYARSTGGGTVDMETLHDQQENVRQTDRLMRDVTQQAKSMHIQLAGCGDRAVRALLSCQSGGSGCDPDLLTLANGRWFSPVEGTPVPYAR